MQKDTSVIVKISSILQCQKIPERLENHFFPNWKQQKTRFAQSKTKNENEIVDFFSKFF